MFLGRYEHTINGQGRTSIPVKFREELRSLGDDRLIITNEVECLVAWPKSEWQKFMERLMKLPQTSKEFSEFVRFYVSGAQECQIDKLGRVLVPPNLREHAGLNKEIVLAGMINKIEIWSKERWAKKFSESQENHEKNKQKLAEWGL